MMAKIVHTAKHTVKAMVDIQSARLGPAAAAGLAWHDEFPLEVVSTTAATQAHGGGNGFEIDQKVTVIAIFINISIT